MRFRPSFLFYGLAAVSVILIPLTRHLSLDINIHDTYFILSYFHYLAAISIMALLTGLVYSLMAQLKKPIPQKIALVHFVLIVTGLVLSVHLYKLVMVLALSGGPDTAAFAFGPGIVFAGPLLLISGAVVFVYGIIRALINNAANV